MSHPVGLKIFGLHGKRAVHRNKNIKPLLLEFHEARTDERAGQGQNQACEADDSQRGGPTAPALEPRGEHALKGRNLS